MLFELGLEYGRGSGGGVVINVSRFLKMPNGLEEFKKWLTQEFTPKIYPEDRFVVDGSLLWRHTRQALIKYPIDRRDQLVKFVLGVHVAWNASLWSIEADRKVSSWDGWGVREDLKEWVPGLFVRAGNVELRALKGSLLGEETSFENLELEGVPPRPRVLGTSDGWLDHSDQGRNVRKAMTNAGWYPDSAFSFSSFRKWGERYSSALLSADALFHASHTAFFELSFEVRKIATSGVGFRYLNFPDLKSFYRAIRGHDVLFVTPFKAEIDDLRDTGDLFDLWEEDIIEPFELETIQAPMSIYPHRPRASWEESFAETMEKVRVSFSRRRHTLFTASCGSYSIPLCHAVLSEYGIASFCFGNYVNFLFGIRQNGTEQYAAMNRKLSSWRSSSLGQVAGLSAVDGGRYTFGGK